MTQADADVALTFTTIAASTVDLSAVAGAVTITQSWSSINVSSWCGRCHYDGIYRNYS